MQVFLAFSIFLRLSQLSLNMASCGSTHTQLGLESLFQCRVEFRKPHWIPHTAEGGGGDEEEEAKDATKRQ